MNNEFREFCKNSRIEKHFLQILNDVSIKVVSFDIFDTLAVRKVATPSDIFYEVGKDKYVKNIFQTADAFKLFRMKAESKARTDNLHLEDITFDLIYKQLALDETQIKTIQKIELKKEKKSLYINKQVESWIQKACEQGKKVVLISDMYLSKKHIDKLILSKLKNKDLISKLYVSSEYNKSKSKGGLFTVVKNDLDITCEEWFHIGDNIHSDVNQASKLNIKTLHYRHNQSLQDTFDLEKKYIKSNIKKVASLRKLITLLNPYIEEKEHFYFNLGASIYAPALWNFSHYLKDLAKKEKITQINFVMREGKILEKYFRKISTDINTNLIYASRKSIFLASLDSNSFKISDFNFHIFRKISIKDLYSFYKINIKNKILQEYKNTLCIEAKEININNTNLLVILNSDLENNRENIKENIKKEQKLFYNYINTFDIHEKSIFVDFGGTGTLLEHMSNTLKDKDIVNVLFYMHEDGYRKMSSFKAYSFLPLNDKTFHAIKSIRRTPELTEILLNGTEQTTKEYKKIENKVIPVTMHPHTKMAELHPYIESFNEGIDAFFETMKEYKFKNIINNDTLALIFGRIMNIPSQDEVQYLGDLYHDEGKGSKMVQKLVPSHGIKEIKEMGVEKIYLEYSKSMYYKRDDFHWIQGIISRVNPTYIASINGLINEDPNQKHILSLINILRNNRQINKLNIYGAGDLFLKLKPYLEELNIEIISVMDTRALTNSFYFDKYKVISLPEMLSQKNKYPILIASIAFELEITNYISNYVNEKNISIQLISRYAGLINYNLKIRI